MCLMQFGTFNKLIGWDLLSILVPWLVRFPPMTLLPQPKKFNGWGLSSLASSSVLL